MNRENIEKRTLIVPRAEERDYSYELFGVETRDEYKWLQDKDDPKVMEYIDAENSYADDVMSEAKELRNLLFQEIRDRIDENEISSRVKDGDFLYYSKYKKDLAYPIYCRRLIGSPDEEILLDQNKLAEGHDFCSLAPIKISHDGSKMLYGVDYDGAESFELHVADISSGEEIGTPILGAFGDFEWAADGESFFYTVSDEANRPYSLFLHTLGRDRERDVRLYEVEDREYSLYIESSKSKKYLFVVASAINSSYVDFIPLAEPLKDPSSLSPRIQGVEYYPYHAEGRFYLRTNDKSLDFKIISAEDLEPLEWFDSILAEDGRYIEDFEAFDEFIAIKERKNGNFYIRIVSKNFDGYVDLPDNPISVSFIENVSSNSPCLRFSIESFTTPLAVFDYYFMDCRLVEVWRRNVIGYDSSLYDSIRLFARSRDGVSIPITAAYRKDRFVKGSSPCFLMGYGAYGYSYDPSFSSDLVSLMDRGFMCATAHVRGGEELGRKWYLDGKLLKKKNSFYDYVSCCEFLKSEGFVGKIAAYGRSAGGLLIGASLTMRPDVMDMAVLEVPFVDALNTMLDESLPLTAGEYNEWGNPHNKEYFDYIRSYSPYDNIAEVKYPPLFIYAAWNDTRVMYWEPLKFMAKIRKARKDDNVSILKFDKSCGHFGASGRYDRLKEKAYLYSFIIFFLKEILDV